MSSLLLTDINDKEGLSCFENSKFSHSLMTCNSSYFDIDKKTEFFPHFLLLVTLNGLENRLFETKLHFEI